MEERRKNNSSFLFLVVTHELTAVLTFALKQHWVSMNHIATNKLDNYIKQT